MRRKPVRRMDELFHTLVAHPANGRTQWLLQNTAGDDELRRELTSLLAAHASSGAFLEAPVFGVLRDADLPSQRSRSVDATALIGAHVGDYRLDAVIAEGGMGVVYRAVRMVDYQQEAAVKLVQRGLLSDDLRRRFHVERQALARLRHDSITRLLDGGTTIDGSPYLVMEYIEGKPIDVSCDERALGIRERIALFCDVCDAVHYAHQNLVVHRDIKPTNILITADGRPKLLDFGIAKLVRDDASGGSGDATTGFFRLFTPRYAAPEQMRGDAITTAADVYSLGVVLYELLCGRRPYLTGETDTPPQNPALNGRSPVPPSVAAMHAGCAYALRRPTDGSTVLHAAAARSSTPGALRKALCGDLDNVVLKALEFDPRRRYGSAREMADDLRNHLRGLPVAARNGSGVYRLGKFVRRHAVASGLAAALAVALVAGALGTGSGLVQARSDRRSAEQQRSTAVAAQRQAETVAAFFRDTLTAANPYQTGRDAGTLLDLLADAGARIDTDYTGQPAAEAAVRYALAETYAGLWRWGEAGRHAERALELNQGLHGNDHPVVADCLVLWGRSLTFALDSRAVGVQEEALAMRRRFFREDSPEVAWSKTALAFAFWHAAGPRRYAEAEALYLDAVRVHRREAESHPMNLAMSLHSLGAMYCATRRPAEAARMLGEAVVVYRSMPVRRNRYLAECVRAQSAAAAALGREEESVALLREYIELTPPGLRAETQVCDALTRLTAFLDRRARWAGGPGDAEFFRARATEYRSMFATNCDDDTEAVAVATSSR